MHRFRVVGMLLFTLMVAACSAPVELRDPKLASNLEVLVALNELFDAAGRNGAIDPKSAVVKEASSRNLLTIAELTNLRRNRVERGRSKAQIFASRGMPSHLQIVGPYQVLYYYRNVGIAFQRQIITVQGSRVVGLASLVSVNGSYRWSGSGILPTSAWKLPAPELGEIFPPAAPENVITCSGPSDTNCSPYLQRNL